LKTKEEALNDLLSYREKIEDILAEMEAILMAHFEKEYSLAHQHWLPQIKTSLRDNLKYLPRGDYSMDYTINHILDSIIDNHKGVSKYIT
jgi:hypothetical protein